VDATPLEDETSLSEQNNQFGKGGTRMANVKKWRKKKIAKHKHKKMLKKTRWKRRQKK
jgi:hypothetical protein